MEGLIFGGAYLQREICISKLVGLALQLEVNLLFLLYFTLYLMAIFQVQAPGRGLFSEFYGIPLILFQRKSAALVVP